ncbi:MAG TPA: alpha/beta hydrolase [Gemmatimonadales bacterium]|nr:alpha/beta hydrolase [Gemmatimonadales bacterium]
MRAPRSTFAALLALTGLAVLACETLDPLAPGNLVPATVADDPTIPAIDMNGSRFHVQTFGDPANPVIVFVHGGPGGDHRSLLRLGERINGYSLADEYFLVYWDQRGSGLSRRHDKDLLTIDVFMSDFDSIVNRYSPGRPVLLIGESWGGMYATNYINLHPQKVAGAVLVEPGPLDGPTAERIEGDMFDLDIGSEWLNDYAWSSQFLTPDDHARMDYERMLGAKNAQPRFHEDKENPSPVWRLGAAANRYVSEDGQDANGNYTYDFTTNLDAFTTPVLFIAGAWSEVLGESLQQEQILKYPSAALQVVNDAGHDVAWVKTAEVLTLVRGYLDARKGAAQ